MGFTVAQTRRLAAMLREVAAILSVWQVNRPGGMRE